ncbi:MAG TPA: hypothetical protein VIJ93_09655 [bacterium]
MKSILFGLLLLAATPAPDSSQTIIPPNLLKGNCPGETLSLNFLQVFANSTGVDGVPIVGATAKRFILNSETAYQYRGKKFVPFDLPNVDVFWVFPTNGEAYPELIDWAFVFGIKSNCVVSFVRVPIGMINTMLTQGAPEGEKTPQIVPHVGQTVNA